MGYSIVTHASGLSLSHHVLARAMFSSVVSLLYRHFRVTVTDVNMATHSPLPLYSRWLNFCFVSSQFIQIVIFSAVLTPLAVAQVARGWWVQSALISLIMTARAYSMMV